MNLNNGKQKNKTIPQQLEQKRFGLFDGYVSVPIFEPPKNYSTYHDSDIDSQIVVMLPEENDENSIPQIEKNPILQKTMKK